MVRKGLAPSIGCALPGAAKNVCRSSLRVAQNQSNRAAHTQGLGRTDAPSCGQEVPVRRKNDVDIPVL